MIKFVEDFKAAKTSTIQELFYPSYRVALNRLTAAVKAGELRRERDGWSAEYIYYTKKPKQLRHALLLTDFYRELNNLVKIVRFVPEPTLDNIRPDAVVGFSYSGKNRLALVEIEISHKGFDCKKYESFQWQKHFPIRPEIIVVSGRDAPIKGYTVSVIKTDLSDLSKII